MRCVSHEVCHKTTQREFKSYFRAKRVRLTLDGLQIFAWMTSEGRPGQLVKELTLVGDVYDQNLLNQTLESSRVYERIEGERNLKLTVCTEEQLAQIEKSSICSTKGLRNGGRA